MDGPGMAWQARHKSDVQPNPGRQYPLDLLLRECWNAFSRCSRMALKRRMLGGTRAGGLLERRFNRISRGHVWHRFTLTGISRFDVRRETAPLAATANCSTGGGFFGKRWTGIHFSKA